MTDLNDDPEFQKTIAKLVRIMNTGEGRRDDDRAVEICLNLAKAGHFDMTFVCLNMIGGLVNGDVHRMIVLTDLLVAMQAFPEVAEKWRAWQSAYLDKLNLM